MVVRSWELSEREAEQLERLLDAADLMALPPEPRPPPGGDRFQFDLAWQRDDESGFLRTYDGEMPTGLRALIDWLLARD